MSKTLSNYLLLLGIGVIWGAQFMFNDMAINSLSPDIIATLRVVIGAVTMVLLMLILGRNQQAKDKALPNPHTKLQLRVKYVLIALFEGVIPFFSIAWGQQYIDSSIAAVLVGTVPIFTGLLVALFIPSEKVGKARVMSILLGFIGLLVLVWPSLVHAQISNILAELAILGGAFSFAIAITLIKTLPGISPVRLTRNVLLLAAIPLVIYVAIMDPLGVMQIGWKATLSVLALGVFCSGIVYIMYVKLINSAGATFASLSNYLVPLFGTIFGVVLMGDPPLRAMEVEDEGE